MSEMDNKAGVIILQRGVYTWIRYSMDGVNVAGQRIDRIADYVLCPWLISTADSLSVSARAQSPRARQLGSTAGELVLYDCSAFHDELDVFKLLGIGERVTRDRNQVGVLACVD